MQSRWHHHKEQARTLRKAGTSITVIERRLGIPRSTLSGWLKDIQLTPEQRARLDQNSVGGGAQGRRMGAEWNRLQKVKRLATAESEAKDILAKIEMNDEILNLGLAMLYLGEGSKSNVTSMGNSDPRVLRFMLTVLRRCYGVTNDMLRCDLHLRMDQDAEELKAYWSNELQIPIERFKYVAFDKRTEGKATYDHYKGVCLVNCGNIAIQRKLIYLYNLFCDQVAELNEGG